MLTHDSKGATTQKRRGRPSSVDSVSSTISSNIDLSIVELSTQKQPRKLANVVEIPKDVHYDGYNHFPLHHADRPRCALCHEKTPKTKKE